MDALNLIAAIVMLLLVQVLVARRLPSVLGALVTVQAAYWAISYVLRPLVLVAVQPSPRFGDSVADQRLSTGGYDQNLPAVLGPVALGLAAYTACMLVISLSHIRRRPELAARPVQSSIDVPIMIGVYLIGIGARALTVAGTSSPLLSIILSFGSVGAGAIVLFAPIPKKNAWLPVMGLVGTEVLWSLLSQSKTPVMALVVAIILRFAYEGWTRRRRIAVVVAAGAAAISFPTLQSIKFDSSTIAVSSSVASSYPPLIRPFMSVITRFDLLSAVTDARLIRPGAWLSVEDYVSRIVRSLVPQQLLGSDKLTAGQSWAIEVSRQSQASVGDNVSRADGFIAEGLALGGNQGVIAAAIILALATLITSRLLVARQMLARYGGLLFVMNPIIFERGALGLADTLGKGIQVLLLIAVVILIIGIVKRGLSRRSGHEIDVPATPVP